MEIIKKECKVVMLPTNEKSHIYYTKSINKLGYVTGHNKEDLKQFLNQNNTQNQHLYILSNEEIKKGDWCYSICNQYNWKYTGDILEIDSLELYKIIASTDPLLNLPKPSQSFIKKYCKSNGEIDKVMVEYYQQYYHSINDEDNGTNSWTKISKEEFEIKSSKRDYFDEFDFNEWLKTNSKNEVSISPIKNSWNREEIEVLCRKAYNQGMRDHQIKSLKRVGLSSNIDLATYENWKSINI